MGIELQVTSVTRGVQSAGPKPDNQQTPRPMARTI